MNKKYSDESCRKLSQIYIPSYIDYILLLSTISILSFSLFLYKPFIDTSPFWAINALEYFPLGQWFSYISIFTNLIQRFFVPLLFLGAVIVFFYLKHKNVDQYSLRKPDRHDSVLIKQINICSKKLKLKSDPTIFITSDQASFYPWVFWSWRNIIIVPDVFSNTISKKSAEFRAIILHELAHIRSGDTWKILFLQCFSVSYVFWGTLLFSVDLLGLLPELHWTKLLVIFSVIGKLPQIFSVIAIIYLNIIMLRERELVADRTTALAMGTTLHLRKALASATLVAKRNSIVSLNANKQRKLLGDLFRPHPKSGDRNKYLFDPRLYLIPKFGFVFVIGFVSILAVEAGLRSLGFNPIGEGVLPLTSVLFDTATGVYGIGLSFIPLVTYVYSERLSRPEIPLLNVLIINCLFLSLGAIFGALISIPLFDPAILKMISLWALFSSYGGYFSLEIGLSLFFSWLIIVIRKNSGQPTDSKKLFYYTLLLGVVPVFIWSAIYSLFFENINTLGFGGKGTRIGIGLILIYIGSISILLALFTKDHFRKKREKIGSDLNFSLKFNIDKLLKTKWLFTPLIIIWIFGFNLFQHFRIQDQKEINSWKRSAITVPSTEAPEGYYRLNDPILRASIVYPETWIPEKNDMGITFYSPYNKQIFNFTVFSPNVSLSSESILSMTSLGLWGIESDPYQLLNDSIPINLQTKAGEANGYLVNFITPKGKYTKIALLNLPSISYGVSYGFNIICDPEDTDLCDEVFEKILFNFDFLFPELGLNYSYYASDKIYTDNRINLQFNYPTTWNISGVIDSEEYLGDEIRFILPDDNPQYWKQIDLVPMDEFSKDEYYKNMIIVQYLELNSIIDIDERINDWANFHEERNHELINKSGITLNGLSIPGILYQIETEDEIFIGSVIAFEKMNGIIEVKMFCQQTKRSECENTSSIIIDSLQHKD